ncbi:unnamed protein product [Amoebophrya sp. A120]|nr:unnamed protein product [Amoebophrya sp. A120]|eukprot:GSA120T00021095001.1
MLSQHLWPHHETPPSITSFQTQTFLHLIYAQKKTNLLSPNYQPLCHAKHAAVSLSVMRKIRTSW